MYMPLYPLQPSIQPHDLPATNDDNWIIDLPIEFEDFSYIFHIFLYFPIYFRIENLSMGIPGS